MRQIGNTSSLQRQFQLLAFSKDEVEPIGLFIAIVFTYMLSTLLNLMITALVCLESQLHTPMYFFLCNLSIQDIIYVSAILPKLMHITVTGDTSISFAGCVAQLFVFLFCVCVQFLFLTFMAYDRYVAICNPLHYALIMNCKVCVLMACISWVIGILNSVMYCLLISTASFCNFQEINHFFCDLKAVLQLPCSDTTIINVIIFVDALVLGFLPFLLIITSYAFIIFTILKIRTSTGRLKTFSSCSSHITIVLLFFGTCLSVYVKHSQEQDKLLSLLYIVLVPMLNPLVYSLRNKQVLKSMRRFVKIRL